MQALQARIREKGQFTIPASVMKASNLQAGDIINLNFHSGVLSLDLRKPKRAAIADYIGIVKGAYGKTGAEVNKHIRTERKSWEK